MSKIKNKLSGLGTGIVLSASLSFLISVYAPLELYLTNISEFWMRLSDLIPTICTMFFGLFLAFSVALIICKLINNSFFDFCLAVGTSILFGLYICGNFLVKNLPPMNGTVIQWEEYPGEILKSVLAFIVPFIIVLIVLILIKSKKFRKIISTGSFCFLLLFVITLVTLILTTDLSKPEALSSTDKNLFEMSKDKNVIVLVLDTIDGDVLKKAINKDEEIKDLLDGFTCYDDTLAAYPYTKCALPMLFSGEWYENNGSLFNYRINAVSQSPFITTFEQNGYDIGLYESFDLDIIDTEFKDRFENCFNSNFNHLSKDAYKLLLKMGGTKFAPWFLKFACGNIENYSVYCRIPASDYNAFLWSDISFYKKISDNNPIKVIDNKKCARIIHLEGGHMPFLYDKNFNEISNGDYLDKVGACVNIVKQYIKHLKESGVYDNTAIVIVGDHGSSGGDEQDEYNIRKRMHAGFMVKGFDEHHDFKYSSAPIQYDEIAGGIAKLVDGAKSDELFDVQENEQRTRRMILYVFNDENHMKEYITNGKASNPDAMKPTGKEYNIGK